MQANGRKRLMAIGAALVFGTAVAATAVSCSHGHGKMTPERMKTIVTWKVNDVLDDIDATSAQRKVILDAAYKVLADFGKLHAQGEADREKLLAELESSQPREAVIDAMIDTHLEAFKGFLHRTVGTLLAANTVLDREQRAQLAEMARAHMQKD
jgi:periplasmic protein CpxP/Spy